MSSAVCRLIIDEPAGGAWNMAVDEVLLENAVHRGELTLRFYQWTPATLSLGYFQSHAQRVDHASSRAAPMVRRATGGGAIVHDSELTYSVSAPPHTAAARAPQSLYDQMHESLIGWLATKGVDASLHRAPPGRSPTPEPFLCFARRSAGDVVLRGHKIVGSAQRRRAGAVLQHGSLLLSASALAPLLPGLAELAGLAPRADDFAMELAPRMARALGFDRESEMVAGGLTADERTRAAAHAERFAGDAWTHRR